MTNYACSAHRPAIWQPNVGSVARSSHIRPVRLYFRQQQQQLQRLRQLLNFLFNFFFHACKSFLIYCLLAHTKFTDYPLSFATDCPSHTPMPSHTHPNQPWPLATMHQLPMTCPFPLEKEAKEYCVKEYR